MDFQRIVALVIFAVSSFLLLDAWQRKHQAPVSAPAVVAPGQPASDLPAVTDLKAAATPGSVTAPASSATVAGQRIQVRTDTLAAEIDTAGGDLRQLALLTHKAVEDRSKPLLLLQDKGALLYWAQSGLLGAGLPNHNTLYTSSQSQYELKPGEDKLEVRLTAPATGGVSVEKVLTFHRGKHLVDVRYDINNGGAEPLAPIAYFQLVRNSTPPPGEAKFLSSFTGPTYYTDLEKFKKISWSDLDKAKSEMKVKSTDGWVGMVQQYFVAAWLPAGTAEREIYASKVDDVLYRAGVKVPVGSIEPGKTGSVSMPLYAGPQHVEVLETLAPGLELVKDFGWLKILAYPLFWVLKQIHGFVGNWGIAIILLTVFIKGVFYPLQAKAGRSMAQMKLMAPRLQKLKEQYGDDRQKLNQAMMEIYRKEKINPLGGCLPILIQIPVFIALYWVLLATVELRHAPFYGWIQDLSGHDPFYILPLVMGGTMFWQMKVNPPNPDPIQQRVFMIMPVVFTFMFLWFPSGLVLYWIVNNVLSIAQQWHINRTIEREAAAKAHGGKKG